MIRFIILFITRVKRFSCCFLRIVRVYPIDTTNRPLHEWQPHSTVFTQGRAAVPPGHTLCPRHSAKINPARLLRAGYPAMKNSPNGVKNKQRTKAVNAFLFIMQNRVKSK